MTRVMGTDQGVAVPEIRFNHMELTFPRGTLTNGFKADIDAFYGDVFGFTFTDSEVVKQLCHVILAGDGDFILLAESDKPMSSPGYDHLGFLMPTRVDVDETLAKVKQWQQKDDRVQIKEYEDIVSPTLISHSFYVRYLLPLWFDVQCMEHPAG